MGLAIGTGLLADLLTNDPEGAEWIAEQFEKLNRFLEKNGIARHQEPTEIPSVNSRGACHSFPYSYLHYLRRAVAFSRHDPSAFAPAPDDWDPGTDPLIDKELFVYMDSHLICHSDCEGFYIPVDFESPLVEDRKGEVPGAIVGSSYGLLRELTVVAPLLGIHLDEGLLSDAEARTLANEDSDNHPLGIERLVWFALFEAASKSCKFHTAIVFH